MSELQAASCSLQKAKYWQELIEKTRTRYVSIEEDFGSSQPVASGFISLCLSSADRPVFDSAKRH